MLITSGSLAQDFGFAAVLGGCPRIEAVARESGFESAILIIIGSIK
jgi:hypothetical protein